MNQTGISLKHNRKIKIFLFFLILTSIIWLLIELSKTYTANAVFKLSFTNVPSDKLLLDESVREVHISFRAPGFTVLKHKIKNHNLNIDLGSTLNANSSYYVLPNIQIAELNSQLAGDITLLRVQQDSLFVSMGINKYRKVPVRLAMDVNFKLGYNFTNGINVQPDSVTISGPEQIVDTLSAVSTDFLKLDEVYQNINEELNLVPLSEGSNVVFSTDIVKVVASVDKFTEGSFKIPVIIINTPEGVNLNAFPKEIEVVYQAGLANFSQINKRSVDIVFNYQQYQNDTLLRYLTPVIVKKSNFISQLKLNPNKIEFLIQK